ncbi:hypothetical protein [Trinickia acidisoli]|uniref:hypothetical protein n=1 Tax=Trinickia acidisoli TaxID=2767482 RepID=UPI001A8DB867|nr:hypothetical protein [Trinickia acidisoli]
MRSYAKLWFVDLSRRDCVECEYSALEQWPRATLNANGVPSPLRCRVKLREAPMAVLRLRLSRIDLDVTGETGR